MEQFQFDTVYYTRALTVLRGLRNEEIVKKIEAVFLSYRKTPLDFCEAYGCLCGFIWENGTISHILQNCLLYDENLYAHTSMEEVFDEMPEQLKQAVNFDLGVLKRLSTLQARELISLGEKAFPDQADMIGSLPEFPEGETWAIEDAKDLYDLYRAQGYGFFAKGKAFYVRDGEILTSKSPDKTRLQDLKGYQRQKQAIIANTLSFLKGGQYNNILLYGDKGTGKSSTVKAIVNEYANMGLKIIELKVNQMQFFPRICEAISRSPFKFILFLDDLSFSEEDENFSALKAFIEGSVSEQLENMAIYATSNRRHLIKENFEDRQGSDVNIRDTLESITSLSDRFGLEITFEVPNKDEYLDIIDKLAEEYGIHMEKEELHMQAERFALRRSGRSPRTARQFMSYLASASSFS